MTDFGPLTGGWARGERAYPGSAPQPDRDLEHEALRMLREHGPREGQALAAYKRLADESTDSGFQYLMRLILEDEERHHRVIAEMAHQIESFLWDVDVEPSVPYMGTRLEPALVDATRQLLDFEREDSKELRRLRKQLRQSPKSSLLPLLVDLMVHDTAKHIAILKFIRGHVARR